ncbi:hypothetical protein LINPERPRIM_LOCUS23612 [Linum perenne]
MEMKKKKKQKPSITTRNLGGPEKTTRLVSLSGDDVIWFDVVEEPLVVAFGVWFIVIEELSRVSTERIESVTASIIRTTLV